MPDIALIRSETEYEFSARRAGDTPVLGYLVVELFPDSGVAAIREEELPAASKAELLHDLAHGQWDRPHRILFIDEAHGICRDASAEIAASLAGAPNLSSAARDFCARHAPPLNPAVA